ncbi:CDP-glycerol glycerophosphotransferase family protein [Paenarthrobacter sp. A20]|uniref:CDP-glycerol glycerophosphotransferase family protein n=1 Tax=Paenarthrobacter sp. A20 TaxID=2817891 RepID=UPI0020A1DE3C|nr:CDP-glycerol glycerophosphotransferase family protein [Paenarthrobacter sp. A20]MCP1413470.1 CDP-glycerol glycerophosphotransferase (TagB/SpsB family) [Paenarthrobacter sp. A20]
MPDLPPLLTIVLEETGQLDRESAMYRRLLAARLRLESQFAILHVEKPLTTAGISQLCEEIESKYVIFMRTSHLLSANYVSTIFEYLRTRTVYLAEPVVYTGAIAKNVAGTKIDEAYLYSRDTDVFGVAFNTRRLADALEALGDVDRSAIYISYRMYWSIAKVKPLNTGFSMASDTKAAIGLHITGEASRLAPVIPTSAKEVRLHLLRYVALFLRGMRGQKATSISLSHLRELIRGFDLIDLLALVEPLQPFEAAWIRWLDDPAANKQFYKQLSDKDAYLVFRDKADSDENALPLYELLFNEEILTIERCYLARNLRSGHARPGSYNFYNRPIGPSSTILFFDRPLQADDNAEHLYEYFTKNHPEFNQAYFALNPKSPDWERLESKGFKLIPIFTKEFYEKFLVSDLVVSSQIYSIRYRGKSFANSRFVYLQHGIQLNDMSDWVLSKYFDVFVATGRIEADYMSRLAPVETLNSGLPRYQSLARNAHGQQHLLFMPTWRFNLHQSSSEHFAQSTYFRAIDKLLSDPALLEFLEDTDRVMHVKLHPNVEKRAGQFRFSERVVQSDLSYREAIRSAEMVLTDYSSAALDAAFIGTPIVYYHWDAADFFRDQPYESRLDYVDDGLGPVFSEHAEVVEHIIQEGFADTDPKFIQRRERFFEGVDPARINEKIVERMLSL